MFSVMKWFNFHDEKRKPFFCPLAYNEFRALPFTENGQESPALFRDARKINYPGEVAEHT